MPEDVAGLFLIERASVLFVDHFVLHEFKPGIGCAAVHGELSPQDYADFPDLPLSRFCEMARERQEVVKQPSLRLYVHGVTHICPLPFNAAYGLFAGPYVQNGYLS